MSGIWWLINNETVTVLRNTLLSAIARVEEDYPDKEIIRQSQMFRDALHALDSGLHDNEGHIPKDFRPKITDFIPYKEKRNGINFVSMRKSLSELHALAVTCAGWDNRQGIMPPVSASV